MARIVIMGGGPAGYATALYGAAVRLFGAFTTARKAAKVKYARRKRG